MRLGSSHGAYRQLVKAQWPRPRRVRPFSSLGLGPTVQQSLAQFQIDNDETPYQPRAEPNPKAKDVAVLGGGITGLATAFELSRTLPNAKITIYEAANRLGGWLDSEMVRVDGGQVLFEWGPRTLRNTLDGSGAATIHMMAHLGMGRDIVATSNKSPASTNRYIYYPDHLVRMPGPYPGAGLLTSLFRNASTILSEPVFKGALGGLFAEPSINPRPLHVEDESVGNFIRRRFGLSVAENLASAFLHGIYAGDLYKLSARTLLPQFYHLEHNDEGIMGSLFTNMYHGRKLYSYPDMLFLAQLSQIDLPPQNLADVLSALRGSSVFTFKRGLHQLVETLSAALIAAGNVAIKTESLVSNLSFDETSGGVALELANSKTPKTKPEKVQHDYLIHCAAPVELLFSLVYPGKRLSQLQQMLISETPPSVNVMVVNLFYTDPNLLKGVRGFGYLLPRSVPLEQNPERALGVIFGSETSNAESVQQDTASGTKLTVMLGGHWWEGWTPLDLPDKDTAVEMARRVLERHLGVKDRPVLAKAKLAFRAIPQYQVGYQQGMKRIHEQLVLSFRGRLKMAGTNVQGGVGVNDCMRKGREVALAVRERWDDRTGLEGFGNEKSSLFERWVGVTRDGKVELDVHD